MEIDLPDEMVNLKEILNPNVGSRASGPVKTSQMMLLNSVNSPSQKMIEICDGVFLGGDINFLQEVIIDPKFPYVYLCFGYAGGTGQLESEYLDGRWLNPRRRKGISFTPRLRSSGSSF